MFVLALKTHAFTVTGQSNQMTERVMLSRFRLIVFTYSINEAELNVVSEF